MADLRIKPKAMAVFRRGEQILVNEVRERDGALVGFRIPGGHIEFGEKALDTIHREIREEMDAGLEDVRQIAVLENVFTYDGEAGHEMIFVFEARFSDPAFYTKEKIEAQEDNGTPFILTWHHPDMLPDGVPLFPDGLRDLL